MDPQSSLVLPEDVLRLITDAFVLQSEKNDVLRLLAVSREVKTWLEPRVYSKVVLKSTKHVVSFATALRGEFSFCRPARHVKSLWLLCTDLCVTQHLNGVPELCPNLEHFAFDGKRAPFSSASTFTNERPRQTHLTRLSVCSPSLLDLVYYKEHPPVAWEHLTHLHILGPGDINDYSLYDDLLSLHIAHLTSLQHLCIELTYPSPETELIKYTFFSEAALFYIYLKEGLIREMIQRLPNLHKILIKTNFTYPRFRVLWNDLRKLLEDVQQVSFKMKPLPNQDFYESTLPCSSLSGAVWQTLVQNALDETDRSWRTNS